MARFAHRTVGAVKVPGFTKTRAAVAGATVLMVALLAGGWFEFHAASKVGNVGDLSTSAIAAADAKVVQLTSFSGKADSTKILSGATEHFRATYAKQVSLFTSAVASSNVISKATVDASGVVTATPTHAEVLVATSGTVSNGGAAAQQRYFRFEVTLVRSGSTWLVDDVRFVQ